MGKAKVTKVQEKCNKIGNKHTTVFLTNRIRTGAKGSGRLPVLPGSFYLVAL